MKIIGLTGNSGSGKSTISNIFAQNGGYIIDADKIAHDNIKSGNPAYNEITDSFGSIILSEDKEIDRKKLGKIVFSDNEKLSLLNEISLKYILKKISDEVDTISRKSENYDFIVIDAPLLIETGLNQITHEVWVVFADYENKLKRIIERDNITEEYAKKRLERQTPQNELAAQGDIIIENNGISFEELTKEVLSKLTLQI